MKKYFNKISAALTPIALLATVSCTELDETIYSELSKDNFYNSKVEIMQGVLRPFTHMQAWLAPTGQSGYYYHGESAADQIAWPQKGRHGYDGGDHVRLHRHEWTPQENRLRGSWGLMWEGLGYVNALLEDFEDVDFEAAGLTQVEMESIIAEVKVMRAFHYMKIMDMWGNVPIVTSVGQPTNPETRPSAEVFQFVEEELLANVEKLEPLSQALVGRVSKAAGYAMLSELYLNAEVWSGTPRYDDCITYSDKVINGDGGSLMGNMRLDPSILGPFSNQNQFSPENIFQFAFSRDGGFTFNWAGFFFGYGNMSRALNVTYSGWNAFVVIPTAFDAYEENDMRKKEWFLFGPQKDYVTGEPILGTEEWADQPLVYVNTIRRNSEGATGEGSMTEGEENSGARFNKYRSGTSSEEGSYWENDYVIYRLTEIYFNKAEALMRKNGGTATTEALALVNESRKRAYSEADWSSEAYTASTLTMDELLAERGREFIFEGKRRTDLIRFGKFTTGTWWDKDGSEQTRTLFPIPHIHLSLNPNLTQNPGY